MINEEERSELNEIMQVLDAAKKRHELAFESFKCGQVDVANTSIEQFSEMCDHVKIRIRNLCKKRGLI